MAFRFYERCFRGKIESQQTFWSPGFGMTQDRFGIPWMVNCEAAPAG